MRRQKFKDLPDWPEVREPLENADADPKTIAEVGELGTDSLGQVEIIMALEEAFERKPPKS